MVSGPSGAEISVIPWLAGPAERGLDLGRAAVMGVLNVTPDSFSDGGQHYQPANAVSRALAMENEGARVIDIGAESTRPGAEPMSAATQIERLAPVLRELRPATDCFISVDTSEPAVIDAVAELGADMVNDVRGLRVPGAIDAVARHELAVCVSHMQGEPVSMQQAPQYDDVVADVADYLAARVDECVAAGVRSDRLCVDPGFGFGKTRAHNIAMLQSVAQFGVKGRPILLGVSRKSMFARIFDDDSHDARVNGSLASAVWAVSQGVAIVRAHDVRATVQVCQLADALASDSVSS